MKKEDISFLVQLVEALEDSERKLEEAYKNRDVENFNKIKRFMLEMQGQIESTLK